LFFFLIVANIPMHRHGVLLMIISSYNDEYASPLQIFEGSCLDQHDTCRGLA